MQLINKAGRKTWRKGDYKIVVGNASPGKQSEKLGAVAPQQAIIKLK